jgi:glycosyltransferase involved in cell wall biosynthesis
VRSSLGFVLLDRAGLAPLALRLRGAAEWGAADLLSWSARKSGEAVQRAESDLRRLARARCLPNRLGAMLARHLPRGTVYLNVGHTNLNDRVMWAVRRDMGGRVVVMVHDMIPLDFPDLQRPGSVQTFRNRMRLVALHADVILCNSGHTAARTRHHLSQWGPVPPCVVAPLGVDLPAPDARALPPGLPPDAPYFVALGTIEPRKNHALLLDMWEDWGPDAPTLVICGSRGWLNEDVFRRLDALPPGSPVREVAGLDDPSVAALLAGAAALLMPSKAEGFGLPPVQAAALGTPVICSDLPVFREILGNIPVYVEESDRYLWKKTAESLLKGREAEQARIRMQGFVPPSWEDHFDLVLPMC